MQVKVVIGTVAFMLTMIVLGYSALREPTRLEEFTGAAHGRSVERGAELFVNNCASCHGIDGRAQSGEDSGCLDPATGEPNCVGLPLNNYYLLCGDPPERLTQTGWTGTTENFVKKTIAAGRGAIMPAWSNEFGGPMRPDQVQNVTNYVLNWQGETLCTNPPIDREWAADVEDLRASVEPGDAANGETLFSAQGCAGCHGALDGSIPAGVGPSLANITVDGATRVAGQSADQYVYESILNPNAFIVPECPTGACSDPSLMRGDYAFVLTEQNMVDLLAYLLGQ